MVFRVGLIKASSPHSGHVSLTNYCAVCLFFVGTEVWGKEEGVLLEVFLLAGALCYYEPAVWVSFGYALCFVDHAFCFEYRLERSFEVSSEEVAFGFF